MHRNCLSCGFNISAANALSQNLSFFNHFAHHICQSHLHSVRLPECCQRKHSLESHWPLPTLRISLLLHSCIFLTSKLSGEKHETDVFLHLNGDVQTCRQPISEMFGLDLVVCFNVTWVELLFDELQLWLDSCSPVQQLVLYFSPQKFWHQIFACCVNCPAIKYHK